MYFPLLDLIFFLAPPPPPRRATMSDQAADANASTSPRAASWDLTSSISPHLDLHMMFPLLEFTDSLITSGLVPTYSHADVASSRLGLLRPTHMVDYAMDIYRELHGAEAQIPKEMEEQKAGVFQRLEELRGGCVRFDELCRDESKRVSRCKMESGWRSGGGPNVKGRWQHGRRVCIAADNCQRSPAARCSLDMQQGAVPPVIASSVGEERTHERGASHGRRGVRSTR